MSVAVRYWHNDDVVDMIAEHKPAWDAVWQKHRDVVAELVFLLSQSLDDHAVVEDVVHMLDADFDACT